MRLRHNLDELTIEIASQVPTYGALLILNISSKHSILLYMSTRKLVKFIEETTIKIFKCCDYSESTSLFLAPYQGERVYTNFANIFYCNH